MRKKFFIAFAIALFAGLFASSQSAQAKGLVIYGTADKMDKVAELPDSEDYQTTEGQNFDMGVKYSIFHIFWIPLWVTQEAQPCGYIDGDNYVELTQEDVDAIAQINEIDMSGKVKASFWNSIGGKLIFGLILLTLLIIYAAKPKTA